MIDLENWRKLWALLDPGERRKAWITLGVVIFGALSSALMVGSVMPFLSVLAEPARIERIPALTWLYETFGFTSEYSFVVALGLASIAAIMITSVIQIGKSYVLSRFSLMRGHAISQRLMIAYLRQPYAFFLNRHTGEMTTRVLSEAQLVVNQFLNPAAEFIAAVCTVTAIVGLLLWVDPLVALVAFGVLGGTYGVIYYFTRRVLKQFGYTRADANKTRFRVANEALNGIKDIKLLGREGSYATRYSVPSKKMAETLVRVQLISQLPQIALQAIALSGVILLCLIMLDPQGFASGAALGGILPTLGVFAFAGQRLLPELSKLYRTLSQIQAGGAAVEAVYDDLIDKAGSGTLPRVPPPEMGLTQSLVLEDVSFRYPNAEQVGLKAISLDIRAREKIGIVGSTGAGKTTLADLILGLLSPSEGRLVVDGRPLTDDNIRAWQQSVGYVPQDIFLTDASLSENIALGVPPKEIDEDRVRRSAEIARLDQFIRDELPAGYATTIGERGVRLSGGQRQRVGIARALYHDADLIVFDEATSALDNLTEREVMAAIDALPGDKTVLMIAHRLSTVRRCDRIIVLDQGRLVGIGPWDTLMSENEAFQRIANISEVA
ncbi:MAG: ABC transporter ATP-binding protein [Pseudomonadota bacterium]